MEKRVILGTVSVLFLSFVGAQLFGYSYGGFSISNFFRTTDPATITYVLLFLILGTLIFFGLSRLGMFKDKYGEPNRAVVGVISYAVSALAVYYMYLNGFDLQGLFSGFGISGDLQSILVIIIVVAVAILIIKKLGLKGFFITAGLLLILTAMFTNLIFETGLAMLIGAVLLVIGLWSWERTRGGVYGAGRGIGGAGRFMGEKAWAGARRRPMGAVTIIGIIAALAGFFMGSTLILIIGMVVVFIGLFGKKGHSEFFAQGRGMSKRRAWKEAIKENTERNVTAAKIRAQRARELQASYDHYKKVNHDGGATPGIRDMAYREMTRIAQEAAREGINLRY